MNKTTVYGTVLTTVLLLALSSTACADGDAGAQFLKIGVGARACAMGEAYVAVADDPTAIYWNPAGLTRIETTELLGAQNFWLMDMTVQYLAMVTPLGYGNLGASVLYSSSGDIPKIEDFEPDGEYTAYDLAASVAHAQRLRGDLSIGIALKVIQQKIEEESATGFAVDAGILWDITAVDGLSAALAIQNVGPGITFIDKEDPLPLNLKGGLSYARESVLLAVDLNNPRDNDLRANLGGEVVVNDALALRAGYNSAQSYAAGVGIIWRTLSFDYAFVPQKNLDDSHRVSARITF